MLLLQTLRSGAVSTTSSLRRTSGSPGLRFGESAPEHVETVVYRGGYINESLFFRSHYGCFQKRVLGSIPQPNDVQCTGWINSKAFCPEGMTVRYYRQKGPQRDELFELKLKLGSDCAPQANDFRSLIEAQFLRFPDCPADVFRRVLGDFESYFPGVVHLSLPNPSTVQ